MRYTTRGRERCVSHYVHDFITTAVASGYVASGSTRSIYPAAIGIIMT